MEITINYGREIYNELNHCILFKVVKLNKSHKNKLNVNIYKIKDLFFTLKTKNSLHKLVRCKELKKQCQEKIIWASYAKT